MLCHCNCPDQDSVDHTALTLVREQLAACVSQLAGMKSVYRWHGAIQHANEVLVLIKTRSGCLPVSTACIPELHPHELPELIAVEVVSGHPAHLQWISAQTGKES